MADDHGVPPLEPEFVGESRRLLVDGLLATYDEVHTANRARWVSLEAPTGWGKTRVVREFYNRLAAERQLQPAYWPATILGARPERFDDVSARRKQVHPEVRHTPGSLPSFFWWGIAASLRNGVAADALAEDLAQLSAHQEYLDDVWKKLATWTERNPRWWTGASGAAAEEGLTHLAGMALEAAAGASVPGLGLVLPALQKLRSSTRARAERRQRLASDAEITGAGPDQVDATVELVTRLARPGLPVVIFVEDFHDADPTLAELVTRCANADAAILVITTAWTGQGEQHSHIRKALAEAPRRLIAINPDSDQLPAPFPAGASLRPLDDEALDSVVRFYYPRVDADTLRRLTGRFANPLALELFCSIRRYRDRFPDGDLRLSERDVAALPASINDLYRGVWKELPDVVREALVFGGLGVPVAVAPGIAQHDLSWHRPLLLDALTSMGHPRAEQIAEALGDPTASAAWARRLSENMRGFHERAQWEVALNDDEFLFESDREDFYRALADAVRRDLDRETDAPEAASDLVYRSRLALMLHDKSTLDTVVLAGSVEAAQLALRDLPRELELLVSLGEQAVERLDPGSEPWARVAELHASALDESGRSRRAARLFDAVVEAYRSGVGGSVERAYAVRHNQAMALLRAGEPAAASELLEVLGAEASASLGAADHQVLIMRSSLARTYQGQGRVDEAIELFEQVWKEQTAHYGESDPDALVSQAGLATAYDAAGRPEIAIDLNRSLLDIARSVGNEDDPDTLATRHNLADLLARTGSLQRAIEQFEALVQDSVRILGDTHPGTFRARLGLAATRLNAGNPAEGIAELADLHAEARRKLTPDHPETLEVFDGLVAFHRVSGRTEELITLVEDALADWAEGGKRVELTSLLASLHFEAGRPERAAELTTELALAREREHGEDDPAAIVLRNLAAHSLLQAERTDEAIVEFRTVLSRRERGWGPDDSSTMEARWELAVACGHAGRVDEALALYEEVLADRVRVLGTDNEDSVSLRRDLASSYAELGRDADRDRVLGADPPA